MLTALRRDFAHWRYHAAKAVRAARRDAGAVGWPAVLRLAAAARPRRSRPVRTLHLRGYAHPFHVRAGGSDAGTARLVLVRNEYGCVAAEPGVEYVLDLGANIGAASFFFLHRYPKAQVVAVEPDPGNMAVCRRNLAPFADRVRFVQAGVWSASAPMVVERGRYRDGSECAFQVRPAAPGEPADFVARTVADLIADAGFPRVDLLKMDIEAAEREVFAADPDAWLPKVRTLAVELHDPACEAAAAAALAGYECEAERVSETTVYRNIRKASGGRQPPAGAVVQKQGARPEAASGG